MFGSKKAPKSEQPQTGVWELVKALEPQSPIELKVKACSLAAEARIIKRLEKRQKRKCADGKRRLTPKSEPTFHKLRNHRRKDVRVEARATQLARTFLKGQPYRLAENGPLGIPPLGRVFDIVKKYGQGDSRIIARLFEQWKQAAHAHALASIEAKIAVEEAREQAQATVEKFAEVMEGVELTDEDMKE